MSATSRPPTSPTMMTTKGSTTGRVYGAAMASAGSGVVYATTVVHRPDERAYHICLVELGEGARGMGRVRGLAPAAVRIRPSVLARPGGGRGTGHGAAGRARFATPGPP